MQTQVSGMSRMIAHPVEATRSISRQITTRVQSGTALVALLAIAHVANDMVFSLVAVLLPTMRERFSLTEGTLALIVGVFSISSSVSQPFLGAVIDRIGRRAFIVAGLVVSVMLLSLVAVAPTVWTVVGLLIVGGLGSGAFHPAGSGAARAAGPRGDLAVGLFTGGGMLGLALGPALLIGLLAAYGAGYLPLLMVPGLVLAALLYRVLPPSPKTQSRRASRVFDARLLSGPVGQLTIVGALLHLSFGAFSSAVPLWLVSRHGFSPTDPLIGWTLSIYFLAAALGGVGAGLAGRRYSRGSIVTGTLLLAPIPLTAVLLVDPGTLGYYLLVAVAGALVNAGFPLLIVAAQQSAPRLESTATGMVMGMSAGIAGVVYAISGQFQGVLGLELGMVLIFLTLVPAGILAHRVFARLSEQRGADPVVINDTQCLCAGCV